MGTTNIEDFLRSCDEKIRNERKSPFWCFELNFEPVRNLIADDFSKQGLIDGELQQFIEICHNRLDLLKIFLNDLSIVLGFDFIAISILASLIAGNGTTKVLDISLFHSGNLLLSLLAWFLMCILIWLFYSMLICRKLIYL